MSLVTYSIFSAIGTAAAAFGAGGRSIAPELPLGSVHVAMIIALIVIGLGAIALLISRGKLESPATSMMRSKNTALEETNQRLIQESEEVRQEMSRAEREKERISELYLRKLESSKRRAEELTKILEVGNSINSHLDLELVLSQVVNAVRESLGFKIVLLRMLNEDEGVLEAKAFAGLEADAMSMLEESKISEDTFRSWMREEFRISGSYFISHTRNFWAEDDGGYVPDLGERGEGEWHQDDVLFVPLWTLDQTLLGYLSVDDPADRLVPDRATIELLEVFANQAVTAIQNAKLYTQLEHNMRQLEEAAERMKELNELKSNFVATVSHELRTPLTSITAYVQTLMRYLGSDNVEMQREFLTVVSDESTRLASLIDAILDLSRLEAGKSRLRREEFDAVELVQEAAAFLRPSAEKKRLSVKGLSESGTLPIEADRELMKQALLNLAGNAVKFTAEDGEVRISAVDDGDSLRFEIEDTGIGIPEGELPKIFDRFYQVDSSATRQFGGSGLGLAISKAIVEWHGGKIEVNSQVGRGSKFSVVIPRCREDRRVFYNTTLGDIADPQSVEIIKEIVRMISEVINAKTVSLMVLRGDELNVLSSVGLSEHVARSAKCRMGDGVPGWVVSRGEPILVRDVYSDPRFSSAPHPAHTSRSVLAVPIKMDGEIVGVLNANNKDANSAMNEDDLTLLCVLSDMLTLTWSRANSLSENKRLAQETLSALKSVVEHTRRHKARLSEFSYFEWTLAIAREMELDEEEVKAIGYAATVHDVGMRLLGDTVVEGTGDLSDRELKYLREHPAEGARLVMPLEYEERVGEIILSHHERYDGTGYPNRLKGDEIPMGSRILAVMDAFESMTVGRPYRENMSLEEAVRELKSCSGTQFDPKVVDAILNILQVQRLMASVEDSVRREGEVEESEPAEEALVQEEAK
jgi:signal transduction histidine kinase/HD-GYP domain-containing protein (c-di-GMP phosphodiesterase class II)